LRSTQLPATMRSISVPMKQRNASRCAHDWLAAHVEARINNCWTAGQRLELRDQRVIARIGISMHSLDPGGIIEVHHHGIVERGTLSLSIPNSARSDSLIGRR